MTSPAKAVWKVLHRAARVAGKPHFMYDEAGRKISFTPRSFTDLPAHLSAPFASVEGMAQPDEALCDLLAAALYRKWGDHRGCRARIKWARFARADTAQIGIGFSAIEGAA